MKECEIKPYIKNITNDKDIQEQLNNEHNSIFNKITNSKNFRKFNNILFEAKNISILAKGRETLKKINDEYGVQVAAITTTKEKGKNYVFVNVKNLLPKFLEAKQAIQDNIDRQETGNWEVNEEGEIIVPEQSVFKKLKSNKVSNYLDNNENTPVKETPKVNTTKQDVIKKLKDVMNTLGIKTEQLDVLFNKQSEINRLTLQLQSDPNNKTIQKQIDELKAEGIDEQTEGLVDITNKLIQFSQGNFSDINFTEEAVHVLVDILESKNLELYNNLKEQIWKFKIYKETLDTYKNDPEYQKGGKTDIDKIKKEAVGKLFTQILHADIPEQENDVTIFEKFVNKALDYIKGLFRSLPIEKAYDFIEAQKSLLDVNKEDVDNLSDGVFKKKRDFRKITQLKRKLDYRLTSFKNEKQLFDFFKKESDEIIIEEKKDASGDPVLDENGFPKTEYTKLGKSFERVSSILDYMLNNFFKNKTTNEEALLLAEEKAKKGTQLHSVMESIINRLIDVNTGLLQPNPQSETRFKVGTNLAGQSFKIYDIDGVIIKGEIFDKLEKYATDLLNSYDVGTRFATEMKVMNPKEGYAGTIDFVAFMPDMKIDVLDWKSHNPYYYDTTSGTYKTKGDINTFSQRRHRKQLELYKNALNVYSREDLKFRNVHTVPIATLIRARKIDVTKPLSSTNQEYYIDGIEIGDQDFTKINRLDLLPVSIKTQSTNNKDLDGLIEKLWVAYEKLEAKRYTEADRSKKTIELDNMLKAIRMLQLTKNADYMVNLFDSNFIRFNKLSKYDMPWLNTVEQNQKILSPEQDAELEEFFKEVKFADDFLTTFKGFSTVLVKLFPDKHLRTQQQQNVIDKLQNIENNAEAVKKSLDDKVVETHQKLAKVYDITNFNDKDIESNLLSWFSSLYEKEAVSLSNLAQLKKVITAVQKEKRKQTVKDFEETFEALKGWSKTNKKNIAEAYSLLFSKTKDGIPSLHDKISKEFYKEFREKQAEFKKEYNKIAQTLTKGGYKGVTLENELKRQYQALSKKWIDDNIDLVNFNKLYQEYYNKTKDGIDNTIFDADPVKNDIIKTQKLKDWVVKNDIFTSPDRLYYSELVQPKDGVGESDEYKVLKQSSNKALLNAYNLYFKTNKKAFVLGMLSTYKDLNTFLPKIAETRTIKYSPIEKAFWNNFIVKLKGYSIADFFTGLQIRENYKENYKLEVIDQLSELGNRIPVSFLYKRKNEELSDDLHQIMYKWAEHINSYETLSSFENRILSLNILQKIRESLSLGSGKGTASNKKVTEQVERYINDILYNVQDNQIGSFKYVIENLQRWAQRTFLGLNFKAMLANLSSGITNLATKPEWQGGGRSNAAKASYLQNQILKKDKFRDILGKEFSVTPEFIKFMDTKYFSRHEDESKQFSTGFIKSSIDEALMSGFSYTDHIIQDTTLIANALIHTVIDDKIVNIIKYVEAKYSDIYEKSQKEQIEIRKKINKEIEELKKQNLLIQYSEGKLNNLHKGNLIDFQEYVKDIVKDILGNMSEEDKTEYKLNYIWSKLMFLKNWIPRLASYRLKTLSKNKQKNTYEEGTYRNLAYYTTRTGISNFVKITLNTLPFIGNVLQSVNKTKLTNNINLQNSAKNEYQRQSKLYKENDRTLDITEEEFITQQLETLQQGLKEINTVLIVYALGVLASGLGDDDDKKNKWKWKIVTDLLFKKEQESSFFINPNSMMDVITRNLAPQLAFIGNILNLIQEVGKQGLQEVGILDDETETDAKTSGSYKVARKTLQVVPAGSAIDRWFINDKTRIPTEVVEDLEEK